MRLGGGAALEENAEPDAPLAEDRILASVWQGLLRAGRRIHAAALREGDLATAEVLRNRLRRDMGLDGLDYGAENAQASLKLACHPTLYGALGMEDVCLSGVEKLAARASADGLPLPGYVLKAVDLTTGALRSAACAESLGADPYGLLLIPPADACRR